MSKQLFDLMAESGRAALDDDSVYNQYLKLSPEQKQIADLMAESGRAALDDDSVYNQYLKLSQIESPSEMRARAKAEFASDWLAQKKMEAESIRETPIGKVASALFPRSVENVVQNKQYDDGNPWQPLYHSYDALKDMTSMPGRALVAGAETIGDIAGTYYGAKDYATPEIYDKNITELNPIERFGKSMSNLEGNLGNKIITDPLTLPSLATGMVLPGTALKYVAGRAAIGSAIPMTDVTIEKSKVGETPTLGDALLAGAAGVFPEVIGKFIKPRVIASEMTDPAEEGIRRMLADPGEETIKYTGKSQAFRETQSAYDDVSEALSSGLITPEAAAATYPKFPRRPIESRIGDKIDQAPRVVKAAIRTIPGVSQAEAASRLVGSVGQFVKDPTAEMLTRAILTSYASGDISPTERNAYLRAVETGDPKLIREYKEKYNR